MRTSHALFNSLQLLAITCLTSVHGQDIALPQINTVESAIVRISTDSGTGTATIVAIDDEGTATAYTAKHLFESPQASRSFFKLPVASSTFKAEFFSGGKIRSTSTGSVVRHLDRTDGSIVRIHNCPESCKPIQKRKLPFVEGDRYILGGFSHGDGPAFGIGVVSDSNPEYSKGSTRPTPGQSGGPVITCDGLIGIVVAYTPQSELRFVPIEKFESMPELSPGTLFR